MEIEDNKERLRKWEQETEQLINEGTLDRRTLEAKTTKWRHHLNQVNGGGGEYLGLLEQLCSYTYILDNKEVSVEDAFNHMAEMFGKPEEFIQEVKNKRFYFSREVVKASDDHPQQKVMIKNGTMDRTVLSGAKTANRQLKLLKKQKDLSDALEDLKQTVNENKETITVLQVVEDVHGKTINSIAHLLGCDGVPVEEIAVKLRDAGFKIKDIANHLQLSTRTVKRYLANNQDTSE